MVLQDLHLAAVSAKLGIKEKPRKVSGLRKVVGLDKNYILTSEEVLKAVEKSKMEKAAKKLNQGVKKLQSAHNRAAREWRKAATKRKKEKQAVINAKYVQAVAEAEAAGKPHPPKPAPAPREPTPKKFKLKEIQDIEESEEEVSSEGEEIVDKSQFGGDDDSYIG